MILGVSSYSFTWAVGVPGHMPPAPLSELELLEKAKELEVKLVQIADNMPLHDMSGTRIINLIGEAAASGIEIEVGSNRMTADKLEQYIEIAGKFNSKILRFVIDGEGYTPSVNEIIAIIRNAEPELRKRKIILALENHDRLLCKEFVSIINNISSPFVGICLDCANSLGAGEGFREVVGILAPYAVNFHLKEVIIQRKFHKMGFDVEGRPFGQGQLPLEWMLSQLTDRCTTAILEQWTPPEDTMEKTIGKENIWATQSIRYLRKFIKE